MPVWLTKSIIIDISICTFFLLAGICGTVKWYEAAQAQTLKAQMKAQQEAQGDADEKAAEWEKSLAALRDENKKLSGRLKHETQNTIYSKCVVPDSGVRIYNDALSGSAGGVPSLVMP